MLNRDAIYEALYQRLQEQLAGDIKYFTRRPDHWENVNSQPALLLLATGHRAAHELGLPPIWTFSATVFIYLASSKSDQTPETAIHDLVDRVELALQRTTEPRGGEWGVRLDDLVETIRLVSVDVSPGQDAGQAVAAIQLELVAVST